MIGQTISRYRIEEKSAKAAWRTLAESLDVRGTVSWSPDGRWIAASADEGKGNRLFKIPVDGGAPVRLVDDLSSSPAWSPVIGMSAPICGPA
jgi:Tol biopolymer transport system component